MSGQLLGIEAKASFFNENVILSMAALESLRGTKGRQPSEAERCPPYTIQSHPGPFCMMLGSTCQALYETLDLNFHLLQMRLHSTIGTCGACRRKCRPCIDQRHLGELSSCQHG